LENFQAVDRYGNLRDPVPDEQDTPQPYPLVISKKRARSDSVIIQQARRLKRTKRMKKKVKP
jgi:hypothetical protein